MKKIALFHEPTFIKEKRQIECEMTDSQLAFLCGVLKYRQPKKVVEVGVAHGGTTCVIIECLRMLGYDAELHSVDISEECYRRGGKRTGYLVDVVFGEMPDNVRHKWHLGKTLPQCIEDIGGNVDVIILDTMHIMPGEMLDFLAAFPYLSEKAAVILHDLTLNQISANEFGYATRAVYAVAAAEKIIADGVDEDEMLPGIGAFEVTEDSRKYIENGFFALALTWKYDMPDEMISHYKNTYAKFYDNELLDLFDRAVQINRDRMKKQQARKSEAKDTIVNFHKHMDKEYKLVLYGAGNYAKSISVYLAKMGNRYPDAYVVSDYEDIEGCQIKEKVYHISELPFSEAECNLIMAVSPDKQDKIKLSLAGKRFHSIFPEIYDDYERFINFIGDYNHLKESGF